MEIRKAYMIDLKDFKGIWDIYIYIYVVCRLDYSQAEIGKENHPSFSKKMTCQRDILRKKIWQQSCKCMNIPFWGRMRVSFVESGTSCVPAIKSSVWISLFYFKTTRLGHLWHKAVANCCRSSALNSLGSATMSISHLMTLAEVFKHLHPIGFHGRD